MLRILAWLNLAWHFALHVLTRLPLRPFRRGADLRRFRDATRAEGFVPLTAAMRAELPRSMACIHCGLCAIPCDAEPMSAWDEAWTFVAGASRSLDYAPLVAHDLSACAEQPNTEAVCPMGIPIRNMSITLRALANS